MKKFLDCTACRVWGEVPPGFKESKHFGKCPKCGAAMYLFISHDPCELTRDELFKTNLKQQVEQSITFGILMIDPGALLALKTLVRLAYETGKSVGRQEAIDNVVLGMEL